MSHDASSSDRRFVSVKLKRNNDFQEKFKDKISVTNKDGSFTKYSDSNYSRFASTNKIIGHRAKSSSSFFSENHRTQTELSQSPLPSDSDPPPIFSNSLKNHTDNSTRSSFISTISKDEDVEDFNSYNEYDSFPKTQKSVPILQPLQEPPRKKPIITASELKRMVEDTKPAIYVPSLYEKKTSSPTSNTAMNSKVFNPVNRILHLQEQLSPNTVNSSRSDQGRFTEKVKSEEIFVHKSETSPSTPVKAQHNFPRFFMQNNLTPSRNVSDTTASPERRVQGGYAEAHSNSSTYKSHIRKLAQEAEAKLKQDPQKQQKRTEESFYYSKKPREVADFKPYTLSDYKNEFISNSGYYEMKPLGPDLQSQELLDKQKKREKMLQYANCVKEFNTEQINRDVFVPVSTQKENNKPREKSARERALEFAKSNVPKPVVRRPSPLNVSRRPKGMQEEDDEFEEPAPLSALELMELKNQQDREWIKNEFGLM